jgi:hypothetical protein
MCTPAGGVADAVLNVLVATQNICPVAALVPLVAFSVAPPDVMPEAATVVGEVEPDEEAGDVVNERTLPGYHVPSTLVHTVK